MTRLPYQEEIQISRTEPATTLLEQGWERAEIEHLEDSIVVRPARNFSWSGFFTALENSEIPMREVQLKRPTLETLFLELTGKTLRE
jgi:hypothetical protein